MHTWRDSPHLSPILCTGMLTPALRTTYLIDRAQKNDDIRPLSESDINLPSSNRVSVAPRASRRPARLEKPVAIAVGPRRDSWRPSLGRLASLAAACRPDTVAAASDAIVRFTAASSLRPRLALPHRLRRLRAAPRLRPSVRSVRRPCRVRRTLRSALRLAPAPVRALLPPAARCARLAAALPSPPSAQATLGLNSDCKTAFFSRRSERSGSTIWTPFGAWFSHPTHQRCPSASGAKGSDGGTVRGEQSHSIHTLACRKKCDQFVPMGLRWDYPRGFRRLSGKNRVERQSQPCGDRLPPARARILVARPPAFPVEYAQANRMALSSKSSGIPGG